jgi:hypothetical protein
MIPRPARYPNVDDVINFVQAKFHTRRGRMATFGLLFVAAGAVAVAPSLMHANETPSRQSVVPQTSPIDIKYVPTQSPVTTTTIFAGADLPVGVDLGSRLGGALPTPSTKPPATAPPATAAPATAPPATAPPATAPPATAPPATAPPATSPPLTLPPDGSPIVVP